MTQNRPVHEQCNHQNGAQEQGQADGGLDDQPNSRLIHGTYLLAKPRRVDVRKDMRHYRDGKKHPRAIDDMLV